MVAGYTKRIPDRVNLPDDSTPGAVTLITVDRNTHRGSIITIDLHVATQVSKAIRQVDTGKNSPDSPQEILHWGHNASFGHTENRESKCRLSNGLAVWLRPERAALQVILAHRQTRTQLGVEAGLYQFEMAGLHQLKGVSQVSNLHAFARLHPRILYNPTPERLLACDSVSIEYREEVCATHEQLGSCFARLRQNI